MTIKSYVSSIYLTELRNEHGHKRHRETHEILITGDLKQHSIGEAIRDTLEPMPGCKIDSYHGDVRKRDAFTGMDLQPYDTLIMCHGLTHLDWFEDLSPSKLDDIFIVNVLSHFKLAQRFVEDTIHEPYRKRIIMIGSMAYKAVLNGSAAYCASKAALAHLARCMAWELAPKGFDVFIIHPSNTLGTPMTEDTIQGLMRYRGISREAAESYWNDSPIRDSILTPAEIANLVKFIMLGSSDYLAGTQIDLGGGQR
jgi:3-oxoacyl-[acyl-carrier protein] reductase